MSRSQFTSRMAPWPSGPQVQVAYIGRKRGQCPLSRLLADIPSWCADPTGGQRDSLRMRIKSRHHLRGSRAWANVNPASDAWRGSAEAPKASAGGAQRQRHIQEG